MFTAMAESHQSNGNQSYSFSAPASFEGSARLVASDDEDVPDSVGAFFRASFPTRYVADIVNQLANHLKSSFSMASKAVEDIRPVFAEAAGLKRWKAKWHGWAPIGIPGAKFHAMTGQMEKSHLVRLARKYARAFRDKVIGRPDYYGSFLKYNNRTM